jgi:enamine deaminase RidA (YjgF/YER057c/UK114 family)
MVSFLSPDPSIRISLFSTAEGCDEVYLSIESPDGFDNAGALDALEKRYRLACETAHLDEETLIFSRIFLSDIENQKTLVTGTPLFRMLACGAVSIVGQAPLSGGSVSLFSYHIRSATGGWKKAVMSADAPNGGNALLAQGKNYAMLYAAGIVGSTASDVAHQSSEAFDRTTELLEEQRMSLLQNLVRTWVFVRDIDNNYKAMVGARREFFEKNGLNSATRYLASTGIEAQNRSVAAIVSLDSLSLRGIVAQQLVRMEALNNMPPTIMYGVTFERGQRVRFGDRSQFLISGTASIDAAGAIMHPGDARRQTHRAIDNVEALLRIQDASLGDLAFATIYIRDMHAALQVRPVVEERLGAHVPCIYAHAAVCRPGWLMEIEGVALREDATQFKPLQ